MNQDPGIDPRDEKGAAVHLVALREALRERGAEVVSIDEPDADRVQRRLEEACRELPLSLVYERYVVGRIAAADVARRRGVPFVLEVNAPLADEDDRWRGVAEDEAARRRDRDLFSAACCVLAVSTSVAEYALRRGAAPETVHVVPNAVDPRHFRPREARDPLRRSLVPEGRFAIGFHGRLRPWHGFEFLARAVDTLVQRGAPVHLLVVGRGDFEPLLEGAVPPERRTLVGWRPHADVGRFVACFDALPLTYPPDLPCYFSPLKLREAMACAVVPVVPALGDLPSLVGHGRDGLVYTPGSHDGLVAALEMLVREPETHQRLSRAARLAGEETTWEQVAALVLAQATSDRRRSRRESDWVDHRQ